MSPPNVASKRKRGIAKALVAGDKNHKKKELHPGMNCGPPHVLEWRDFVKSTLLEIAAGETELVESAIAQIEAHAGFTTQHVEAIKEHALHLVMPSVDHRGESLDASVITLAVMMSAEKLAVDVLHDLVEQGFSQEQGRMPKTPIEMVQEAVVKFETKLELSKGKGRGLPPDSRGQDARNALRGLDRRLQVFAPSMLEVLHEGSESEDSTGDSSVVVSEAPGGRQRDAQLALTRVAQAIGARQRLDEGTAAVEASEASESD
jgi:hypothetical protein